jgi:hypothetical protein
MNEPVSPTIRPLPPINPYQSAQQGGGFPQFTYAQSNASTTPSKLKGWYSNEIFKVVAFFFLVCGVLSCSTVAFYNNKLSADQYIGIISSLLMMSVPSPIQTIKKKSKPVIITQVSPNPV